MAPDYVAVRRRLDLQPPVQEDDVLVLLAGGETWPHPANRATWKSEAGGWDPGSPRASSADDLVKNRKTRK